MSARSFFLLLATVLAGPALAQGLEGGVGAGPSEQLSVPPTDRHDPDFGFGRNAVRNGQQATKDRRPHRVTRMPSGQPSASLPSGR